MTQIVIPQTSSALTVNLRPIMELTDERLYQLGQANRELRFERTAQGDLLIMPPTGGDTGRQNSRLTQRLANWADADGTGVTFDASTGFILPNGAVRSPDAAWVRRSRWEALTEEQRKKFGSLCPDFVVELCAATDDLRALQAKMQEYIDNDAVLGWLIDPEQRRVYVYRPTAPVECLERVDTITGDPELPEWVLDLREIWT